MRPHLKWRIDTKQNIWHSMDMREGELIDRRSRQRIIEISIIPGALHI